MKPAELVAEPGRVQAFGQLDRTSGIGTGLVGVAERELGASHAGEALGLVTDAERAERVDGLLEMCHGEPVVAEVEQAAAGLGVQLALAHPVQPARVLVGGWFGQLPGGGC